jgi:glycosyltransferase involved in cell wall biosynthesis
VRLAIVANPNSIHTRRWLRHFSERGHDVHLLSHFAAERELPPNVTVHALLTQIRLPYLRYLALGMKVRRFVNKLEPDLLHALAVSPSGWLGAAANYHPYLVTAWGSDLLVAPNRSRIHRRLAHWVLRRADYVTCVSDNLAQTAEAFGADPSRLEVVPQGVNTDVFSPALPDDRLRAQIGLGPGPVVHSIRALRPVYNPLDVALAIPRVLATVPDAQFVIGTYSCESSVLDSFKAISTESGVANAVHYVGDLGDDAAIAALYRLADVAVSVPSSDGTPLSVLEAMACGAAVVLSDLPSLREWVTDGQEGLFVPVGDVEAISAAIVRLLEDAALRTRLQAHGLELIRTRADSRMWMAHAEEIYSRLVGNPEHRHQRGR